MSSPTPCGSCRWAASRQPLTNPLPVVEIVASDAVAGEFGTNTARFTVVCPNGTNAAPLTVNYSVGGTATPGVDYAVLPGSVTIPAGALATNIFDFAAGRQSDHQPGHGYGQPRRLDELCADQSVFNATAVIQDRPVNNWLRANFTAAQLTNLAVSGDAADPANDGLPNLMKYALGLNPNTADPNPFAPGVANGIFTLNYPLSKSAVDVSLTTLWSTNLTAWQLGTNFYQVVNVADQVTNQIITIQPTTPAASGFFRFGALRR